ncbi:LOW QUALITY PROTEIN: hypothetical protein V2J09_004498 [Rumex salicifolius]
MTCSNRCNVNRQNRLRQSSGDRSTRPTALSSNPALSSSRRSSSSDSSRTSVAVRSAARSVAGAFVACFTPPENTFVSDRSRVCRQNKPVPGLTLQSTLDTPLLIFTHTQLKLMLIAWLLGTDHPIIHRDIKSSNILLTNTRRAKVADFGFARLADDRDLDATHVSTQVKGTAGHMDPEYIKTYQLTDKSVVYSFGALLVELVTGRRAIEPKRDFKERVTTIWATKFMEGYGISVLDPRLEKNTTNNWAVDKILQLALQCLAPQRHGRPTMCAEILWSIRKEYRELLAFSSHFRSSSVTEE